MFNFANHQDLKTPVNSIATPLAIIESTVLRTFKVVSCNELFSEMLGSEQSHIIGNDLCDVFPPYLFDKIYDASTIALAEQCAEELEININRFEQNRWWKCLVTPIVNELGLSNRTMITFIDVTERRLLCKALEKANSRYKAIVASAYDGIISIDTNEKILQANKAAAKIFGTDDLVGRQLVELLPQKYRQKHSEYVQSFKESDITSRVMDLRASVMGLRADGTEIPLEITIARINVDGETELTAVVRDIREKNELIRELKHISTVDNLTSLHNRRYTTALLKQEFSRAKRYDKPLCVLFIDIDHFKQFNDNYGHKLGDIVLKEVSSLIARQLREIDTAGRWGGEEFVVVAPETHVEEALLLAERLRGSIESLKCEYEHQTMSVTVTIGMTSLYQGDTCPDALVERADKCMLKGKCQGRNKVIIC